MTATVLSMHQLESVKGDGEAEDAHKAGGGCLIARGNCPPFIEPCVKPLYDVEVVVDPVWISKLNRIALGGDAGLCTVVPDVFSKDIADTAAIGHNPRRHIRQVNKQRHSVGSSWARLGAVRKATARTAPSAMAQDLVRYP